MLSFQPPVSWAANLLSYFQARSCQLIPILSTEQWGKVSLTWSVAVPSKKQSPSDSWGDCFARRRIDSGPGRRRLVSSRALAFRLWVHNEVIFTTQVYA